MAIYGNNNSNSLNGTNNSDDIYGYGGNDFLYGYGGNDCLDGGSGNDQLSGGTGIDTAMYLDATAGVTVSLINTVAQDTHGAGTDTLSSIEQIQGSGYDDSLEGDDGANHLYGGAGDDSLNGEDSADHLYGGAGNDFLRGGYDCSLYNEYLDGGAGNDTLIGGGSNDTLNGGDGIDTMTGGDGDDTYYVNVTGDVISEMNDAGTDSVISSVTRTLGANQEKLILTGSAAINGTGNDLNNSLTGNGAANTLDGMNGDDTLLGKRGRDILVGRFGNDTISGGGQNDYLFGRDGNDNLTGGSGADIFVFDCSLNSASNNDNITDFSHVNDTVRLDRTIFTKFAVGTLLSTQFRASASGAAADRNDFFLYNTSTGALLYDGDGSGAGVAIQFATLTNRPQNVAYNDFVVVA